MTPGAGVPVLGRGHLTRMRYIYLKSKSSSLLLSIDMTNWMYFNDDQGMIYQNLLPPEQGFLY